MLTMDDIVREGHPVLRKPADAVKVPLSDEDRQTLEEMMQFLRNSQDPETAESLGLRPGVGLAAPQINIAKRMFVVRFAEDDEEPVEMIFVNPKIISHSAETTHLPDGEGCLSVDRNVEGTVPRYSRVKVEATDENGKPFVTRLRGFSAIVFQHEFDHLNGIMFYDRIDGDDPYKMDVPRAFQVIRSQDDSPLSF